MIVSKYESLRQRRNAASLVRLKLDKWADEIERTFQLVQEKKPMGTDVETLVLAGGVLEDRRPRVGSLFETRLAELMGYLPTLDEELIRFHEAVTQAEYYYSNISSQQGHDAFRKLEAEGDFELAAMKMRTAARHAIRAKLYLDDLFSTGFDAWLKRRGAFFGLYSSPSRQGRLEAQTRITKLTHISEPDDEEGGKDNASHTQK